MIQILLFSVLLSFFLPKFQVYQEFQIQLTELTVDNLLEQFTLAKHTGLEKPGRWEQFSYESSLKHSPLKKASSTSQPAILEATKTPQRLLIQTSSVSPTTSSQGNTYFDCGKQMNSRKTKTVKKRHGQKLKEVEKWIKNDKVCKIVEIAKRIE
jgi:hypothetical protein